MTTSAATNQGRSAIARANDTARLHTAIALAMIAAAAAQDASEKASFSADIYEWDDKTEGSRRAARALATYAARNEPEIVVTDAAAALKELAEQYWKGSIDHHANGQTENMSHALGIMKAIMRVHDTLGVSEPAQAATGFPLDEIRARELAQDAYDATRLLCVEIDSISATSQGMRSWRISISADDNTLSEYDVSLDGNGAPVVALVH